MKTILSSILVLILHSCGMLKAQSDTASSVIIEKEIFTIVEVQPQYIGGEKALITFLQDSIVYPKDARERNIQGTVFISFVVEPDGSISSVKCLRGIGGGCDEEAMRVVRAMPNWKPGYQRGKPVRVQFNLPIRFVLQDDPVDTKKHHH